MGPLPQPHSSAFPLLVMWHGESFSLCQAWRVRAGKSPVHALFPRSETSLTRLLSLSLVLPHPPMVMLDTQKKTPMTVLGSPRILKSLSPPCPATQGRNWRKRRKVRCPCPDGLRGPRGWEQRVEMGREKPLSQQRRLHRSQGAACRSGGCWQAVGLFTFRRDHVLTAFTEHLLCLRVLGVPSSGGTHESGGH